MRIMRFDVTVSNLKIFWLFLVNVGHLNVWHWFVCGLITPASAELTTNLIQSDENRSLTSI